MEVFLDPIYIRILNGLQGYSRKSSVIPPSMPSLCCLNSSTVDEFVEDGHILTRSGLNEYSTDYDDDRYML